MVLPSPGLALIHRRQPRRRPGAPLRTAPFRIAHLSDLHLTSGDEAARSEPKLFGALRGMNERFRRLVRSKLVAGSDLLLVTGDVTDRGELAAWQLFWRELTAAGLAGRTLALPGNHDVCCLGLRVPGEGLARRDLERAARGLSLRPGHPEGLPWVHQPDPRVAIFGLNSTNLGNFSVASNAMGTIGYHQLSRFARLLRDSTAPVKIVALHHSPNIPGKATEQRRGLPGTGRLSRLGHQIEPSQRAALRLLCISQRVRLVVHGHLHRAEDRTVDGVRFIGVPASTEPAGHGARAGSCEVATYTIDGPLHRLQVRRHAVEA